MFSEDIDATSHKSNISNEIDHWKSVLSESSESSDEYDENESTNSLQNYIDTEINIFCDMVQEHLETNAYYIFRSIRIDNIYCSIVIYKNTKIICVESVRILTYNNINELENYCLCYEKYNTIEHAISIAKNFVSFKMYDGNLYNDKNHIMLTLEENIIPFMSIQNCSNCKTHTQDTTICGHYICLHCRENYLFSGIKNCQTCGKENILHIYNNDQNAINNTQFSDLLNAKCNNHTYIEVDSNYHNENDFEPIEEIIANDVYKMVSKLPDKYSDMFFILGAVILTELVSLFIVLFMNHICNIIVS